MVVECGSDRGRGWHLWSELLATDGYPAVWRLKLFKWALEQRAAAFGYSADGLAACASRTK